MAFENDLRTIREQMSRLQTQKGGVSNVTLLFDEAYERVLKDIKPEISSLLDDKMKDSDKTLTTTKADMRNKKQKYRTIISKVVFSADYSVDGFDEIEDFIDEMVEEIVGYSVLADAFDDDKVSNIFCLAWNKIYVEVSGDNQPYPKHFRDEKHYKNFIERILGETGKSVNQGDSKIVNAEFYEDRVTVTDKSVSPKGYSLTIRKHKEDHITLQDIINGGTMSPELAELLGTIITGEANMIYAGITSSGKTTSLRAVLDTYVALTNKRMLVAEDTQELFPKNDHTLELVTSPTKDEDTNVSLRDLVMVSLRLSPKYIVIGEVRGVEAEAAVEAMETGHSTFFTMHGGTSWNIINRLVNKYLMQMPSLSVEVVERIIGSSVDYITVQDDIPGIGRRVTSITEVSYDFDKQRVHLIPIFEFDFETETFVQINKLSPDKGNLMMRRGVPYSTIQKLVRKDENRYIESLNAFKEKGIKPKMRKKEYIDEALENLKLVIQNEDDDEDDQF